MSDGVVADAQRKTTAVLRPLIVALQVVFCCCARLKTTNLSANKGQLLAVSVRRYAA